MILVTKAERDKILKAFPDAFVSRTKNNFFVMPIISHMKLISDTNTDAAELTKVKKPYKPYKR